MSELRRAGVGRLVDVRTAPGSRRHPQFNRSALAETMAAAGVLYEWRKEGIYVPDFDAADPTAWSYRDLVYVRLLGWLRNVGMPRPAATCSPRS